MTPADYVLSYGSKWSRELITKIRKQRQGMYGRQTSAPVGSNFIQIYEYFNLNTFVNVFTSIIFYRCKKNSQMRRLLSHPNSPVQEYSHNTEQLLSFPCSNSLSTLFLLRCIALNSLWKSFFPECSSCYTTYWKQINFSLLY